MWDWWLIGCWLLLLAYCVAVWVAFWVAVIVLLGRFA